MLRILRIKHIGSRRSINLFNQIRNNKTNTTEDPEYLWRVAPDTETVTAFPFGYFPWLSKASTKTPVVRELNQDIKEENLLNYSPNLFDFIHTSKVERQERIKKPTVSENILESYILGEESEEKPEVTEEEEIESDKEQDGDKDMFKFNLNKYNKRADSTDRLVTLNSIFSSDKQNEQTNANALIENFFNTTAKKERSTSAREGIQRY